MAGGKLDIDANAEVHMEHPVENIFFAERPGAGSYRVEVNNYSSRISGPTKFTLLVETPWRSDRSWWATEGSGTTPPWYILSEDHVTRNVCGGGRDAQGCLR